MRILSMFLLPLICAPYVLNGTDINITKTSKITSATELIDIPGVKFAGGLIDWKQRPIDSLLMDLYYPTGATSDKKYPLIVFCHAGGFAAGSRFNVSAICDEFADNGFIAVGFDYRLGYDKGTQGVACSGDTMTMADAHYRAVQDAKACLRFLTAHANDYHIDTSKMFLGGSSAGASLALDAAYLDDSIARLYLLSSYQRLGSLESSGNDLTNTYTLKGIVDMWGAIFSTAMIDTNYKAYPSIIFKGDEDGGIPDSAGYFQDCSNYPFIYAGPAVFAKLQQQKVPSVFHFLPQANHPAFDDQFCVEQASCFLESIIAGTPYSGYFSNYQSSCR